MAYTPNPQTVKVTFDDRAQAVAAYVSDEIDYIFVGKLMYVRDATGTALPTNGGAVNWSPASAVQTATLEAWGVTGIADTRDEGKLLTVPTVDETTGIQSAMDWCLNNGYNLIGDLSRVYGFTDTLYWATRTGVTPQGKPLLDRMKLKVMTGGSWTAGDISSADAEVWEFGDAALVVGISTGGDTGARSMETGSRLILDASHIAPVGLWMRGVNRSVCDGDIRAATEAEVLVGAEQDDLIVGDVRHCTASRWIGRHTEFVYGEQADGSFDGSPADPVTAGGYWSMTGRTSRGLVVSSADFETIGCTGSSCLTSVCAIRGTSWRDTGSDWWAGEGRDQVNTVALIGAGHNGWESNGCKFQDGGVVIENFEGTMMSPKMSQYSTGDNLTLRAVDASETAQAFTVIAPENDNAGNVVLDTRGGSWATLECVWFGGIKNSGASSWTLDGNAIIAKDFRADANGHIATDGTENYAALQAGTYTAEVQDSSANVSATTSNAKWTRAGNLVTVTATFFNVSTAGLTGGDQLTVSLPFAADGTGSGQVSITQATYPSTATELGLTIANGASLAAVVGHGSGLNAPSLTVAGLTSGSSDIRVDITYNVA